MPTSTWKPRDERQYRAIVKNCRSGLKTCKRIAAATVNKRRGRGLSGLEGTSGEHLREARVLIDRARHEDTGMCKSAIRRLVLASMAQQAAASAGPEGRDPYADRLRIQAESLRVDAGQRVAMGCLQRTREGAAPLEGLGRAEYMLTRGFKDGNKSWIDVMPARGPKMRVTHEILEGMLGETEADWVSRRTCIAWRYDAAGKRVCAIRGNNALKGLDGVGSSLALMWTAAGAVALFVLSDAQKKAAAQSMRVQDPAARVILDDLNRARAAQGLRPIVR
jgi:hypothetical protein